MYMQPFRVMTDLESLLTLQNLAWLGDRRSLGGKYWQVAKRQWKTRNRNRATDDRKAGSLWFYITRYPGLVCSVKDRFSRLSWSRSVKASYLY